MVYERIRDLREYKDLTLAAVGNAINASKRTYAYYESGERIIPLRIFVALANFYGTSVDYLLDLTDDPIPHGWAKDK